MFVEDAVRFVIEANTTKAITAIVTELAIVDVARMMRSKIADRFLELKRTDELIIELWIVERIVEIAAILSMQNIRKIQTIFYFRGNVKKEFRVLHIFDIISKGILGIDFKRCWEDKLRFYLAELFNSFQICLISRVDNLAYFLLKLLWRDLFVHNAIVLIP